MKVLQKIARFVSVLFGILIHRYRKTPFWCANCVHNKANKLEHSAMCQRCTTQRYLGSFYDKPSEFTINSQNEEKED